VVSRKRIQSIASEIRAFCAEHADEKVVSRYARFFTEGYDAYGVTSELLQEHIRKFREAYEDELGLDGFLQLGDVLLESGKYEEASFAICFLFPFHNEYTTRTFQRLGEWLENGIRNWGHTDVLCGEVLSKFFEKGIVQLESFSSWRESSSKWKRRAVPVSMLALLKLRKDYGELLDFLEPLVMDEDKFVQQALGWFLREAWKRQPTPVEAFLLKWKHSAPRRIFQYATEKMTPEKKEKFRRERKSGKGN
jgi:3-methyladenine DNA glycosylase AlkD